MTTIAVVVVCLAEDDPSALLATLGFADEIHVLTDSDLVAAAVSGVGCMAHLIPRPECIEDIGQRLLEIATCDWTLLVDPDERVRADNHRLRLALASVSDRVAALRVRFTLSIFGGDLPTTFKGLTKTKLLRAGRCSWPEVVHSLPGPIDPADRTEPIDAAVITVASDLAQDLSRRFERHTRWARLEARDRDQAVDVERLLSALTRPLVEYLSERRGVDDGTAGLANALLHVAKEIQRALFEASRRGLKEMRSADRRRIDLLLSTLRQS